MWTAIIGTIGSIVKGIFGLKEEQAKTVSEAIKVVSDTNSSNSQREQAIASIITAEANSESWITRSWRPLAMVSFLVLIYLYFFGIVPENVDKHVIDRLFDLITIGISGYIPARTIEKIVSQIRIGKILQTFIEKKLL